MGVGFVVTILLLATLLGLFSKQVLSSGDSPRSSISVPDMKETEFSVTDSTVDEYSLYNDQNNKDTGHHPHAM